MLSAGAEDFTALDGEVRSALPAPTVETVSEWKKLLARTYTFVGKLEAAETAFAEAIVLTPTDFTGHNSLGACQVQQVSHVCSCFCATQIPAQQLPNTEPTAGWNRGKTARPLSRSGGLLCLTRLATKR